MGEVQKFRNLTVKEPIQWPIQKDQVSEDTKGPMKVTWEGHTYNLIENEDAKKSAFQKTVAVMKKHDWRISQGIGKAGSLAAEVNRLNGKETQPGVKGVTDAANQTWHFLSLTTAYSMTGDAIKEVQEAISKETKQLPPKWQSRKRLGAIQKVVGAVSMVFYAMSTVMGLIPGMKQLADSCKNWGDGLDGPENMMGFWASLKDFWKARKMADETANLQDKKDLHEVAKSTARLNFVRMVKNVCSIAGFAFAMAALLGTTLVAPVWSLGISFASTIVALTAAYYETQMKHEPIKFYDLKYDAQVAKAATPA